MFVVELRDEDGKLWGYAGSVAERTLDRGQARKFSNPADAHVWIEGFMGVGVHGFRAGVVALPGAEAA
jgi:hypothetical protein